MSMDREADLPPGWAEATLEECCLVVQGQSPPGETYNTAGEGLPFFQGKAEFGEIHPRPVKWCSAPAKTAEPGDILISIRAPVGPTNLCGALACIGRGLAAIRPLGGTPPKYLLYALRDTEQVLASMATGTTFSAITGDKLRGHLLCIAPLAEQRRIVAEIETQFGRLEAGVAALKRVQANLRRYRAAALRAASEGRLVPTEAELVRAEGLDYEPGDQLVARNLAEQRARWDAYRPGKARVQGGTLRTGRRVADCADPVKPDVTDLPEIPDGWVWTTVGGMLAEPICNGISVKRAEEPPGVPSLKLNAMSERGFNYELVRFLPLEAAQVAGLHILPGDFFVSRGNGSLALVGRGTVAQAPPFPVIFPDLMMRLRLLPSAKASNWLPTIWPSSVVRRQIERKAKTTAGIWKVAQPDVASVVVPLPSLAEQHRIVAEVERRLSIIDEIEAVIEANLKRAERLRQAILKRAFEGKLVPQDPDDEPASVLLERICAERAAGGKAPKKGRGWGRGKDREPSLDLDV